MKLIQVKVKPNARASKFEDMGDGTWFAEIKSLPIEGKANAELTALIAQHFGLRKSQVSVKSGVSGRMKLIKIEDS
jgi:uncharacterized protein (TIGR00251 family)